MKKRPLLIVCLLATFGCSVAAMAEPKHPNIILFIGDGMGQAQADAASLYRFGLRGQLHFEHLPIQGTVATDSASAGVTDSAAAGTAFATGQKVRNGVISRAIPGDGEPLPTLFELARERGYHTGLVSTAHITHATPAAFVAHQKSRNAYEAIGRDMLAFQPMVMLGGGGRGITPDQASEAGYPAVVTTRRELEAAVHQDEGENARPLIGLFAEGHLPFVYEDLQAEAPAYDRLPHLTEMTLAAMAVLAEHQPYILMVEGARIDHAGHGPGAYPMTQEDRIRLNIYETLALDDAATLATRHACENTLIVVTSDHETGGLEVVESRGKWRFPKVTWSTGGHTDVNVPLAATGPQAERFRGDLDNTDVFRRMLEVIELAESE